MWNVKLSDAIWYDMIWYYVILYNIKWYDLCCDAMRCARQTNIFYDWRVLSCPISFYLLLSYSALSFPNLFCERNEWVTHDKHRSLSTIPYCTVLYCTALCRTVVCCIVRTEVARTARTYEWCDLSYSKRILFNTKILLSVLYHVADLIWFDLILFYFFYSWFSF